jgi:hypothetical protein
MFQIKIVSSVIKSAIPNAECGLPNADSKAKNNSKHSVKLKARLSCLTGRQVCCRTHHMKSRARRGGVHFKVAHTQSSVSP